MSIAKTTGAVALAGPARGASDSASPSTWTKAARSAVIASALGWTFDAFDFFLLVFVLRAIATEFGTPLTSVTFAIVLTLATRPIGAFIFGRAADHYGRRPTLIVVIFLYSVLELASAFSQISLSCSASARFLASPWVASGASAHR